MIRSGNEDDYDYLFPSDEADDSDSNDGMSFFEEEETKSRFTNYSMTSSVLRRNEGKGILVKFDFPSSGTSDDLYIQITRMSCLLEPNTLFPA